MCKAYKDYDQFKEEFSKWLREQTSRDLEEVKAKVVCSDEATDEENVFCVLPTCWKKINQHCLEDDMFHQLAEPLGMSAHTVVFEQEWKIELTFSKC